MYSRPDFNIMPYGSLKLCSLYCWSLDFLDPWAEQGCCAFIPGATGQLEATCVRARPREWSPGVSSYIILSKSLPQFSTIPAVPKSHEGWHASLCSSWYLFCSDQTGKLLPKHPTNERSLARPQAHTLSFCQGCLCVFPLCYRKAGSTRALTGHGGLGFLFIL